MCVDPVIALVGPTNGCRDAIAGCMLALYILSCETAVVWNAATLLTLDEENTIFNSDPGYLVAAIRSV